MGRVISVDEWVSPLEITIHAVHQRHGFVFLQEAPFDLASECNVQQPSWGSRSVGECLTSKYGALSSIPNTIKITAAKS